MGIRIPSTRPKTTPKKPQSSNPELVKARDAVQVFELELTHLHTLREEWSANFPEAAEALEDIRRQEDEVAEALKNAKSCVAAAGTTVGEFKLTKKTKAEHYDGQAVTDIIHEQNRPDIVMELISEGMARIELVKEATAWIARHQVIAEALESAWRERASLTPAIQVPKY